ncbi:hypothetical protein FNV43_RR14792 [Rhamnella rubrinervis]|uniref:Uncharacterized protein n=1 Tax=Rhamnella rubrinervis TaxID=2594499 RepID=A0A8K0MG49_9ROSA|nr:hypothetical protein FNV43_RR14792 [Rhamnella rubrinervis]
MIFFSRAAGACREPCLAIRYMERLRLELLTFIGDVANPAGPKEIYEVKSLISCHRQGDQALRVNVAQIGYSGQAIPKKGTEAMPMFFYILQRIGKGYGLREP